MAVIKKFSYWLVIIVSLSISSLALADDLPQLSFLHLDWDLACDNTRTCRAVAYHDDQGEGLPVSLLLTRKAGPNELVAVRLKLGDDYEDPILPSDSTFTVIMKINGHDIGSISISNDDYVGELTPSMVSQLLTALRKKSRLTWHWQKGKQSWEVSDRGASAVLLKMDEFQGRIGTPGALVKKGSRNEDGVLTPLAMPVVAVPTLPEPKSSDFSALADSTDLRKLLMNTALDGGCDAVGSDIDYKPIFYRLNQSQLLVSVHCWQAAYNAGSGFWLINESPPHRPVLITDSGTNYDNGIISAAHKGRGIGDCWSVEEWAWNGEGFVHTLRSTTGRCTLVAAGGAWQLPLRIMKVEQLVK